MAGAYSHKRVGGVLWSGGRGPTPHWRPPDGHCLLMPSSSSGNDAGAASPTTFGSKPTNCRSAQSEKQQAPPTLAHIVFWNHLKPPWPSARAWLTRPKQEMEQWVRWAAAERINLTQKLVRRSENTCTLFASLDMRKFDNGHCSSMSFLYLLIASKVWPIQGPNENL